MLLVDTWVLFDIDRCTCCDDCIANSMLLPQTSVRGTGQFGIQESCQ
jgi:hypothetical protein